MAAHEKALALPVSTPIEHEALVRQRVQQHLPAVWRMLRRHGLGASDADDGAQRVFLVFARRLPQIEP